MLTADRNLQPGPTAYRQLSYNTLMILVINKKAKSEYAIEKTFYAGIVLSGAEVKSLRNKSGSLIGSYVKILQGEAFLLNAQVSPYKFSKNEDYDPKRTRKLLLKKSEIQSLVETQEKKKRALIPQTIELINNKIKVKIGVGKGLKEFEKREKIKKRDIDREIDRARKNFG